MVELLPLVLLIFRGSAFQGSLASVDGYTCLQTTLIFYPGHVQACSMEIPYIRCNVYAYAKCNIQSPKMLAVDSNYKHVLSLSPTDVEINLKPHYWGISSFLPRCETTSEYQLASFSSPMYKKYTDLTN